MGNILDVNFDWQKLKDNHQCDKVLVEKSTNDMAIAAGQVYRRLIPWVDWIGCAGKVGFSRDYSFIEIVPSESGHSGMINKTNMKNKWFSFLTS